MTLPNKEAQSAVHLTVEPSLQPSPTSEHSIHPYLIPEQSLTTRTIWEQATAHLNRVHPVTPSSQESQPETPEQEGLQSQAL